MHSIRIANADLKFSAGHFITFENGACENLHGHDYSVSVEIVGALNESAYVVDFTKVYNRLKAILETMDHHVLLPGRHPALKIAESATECEISYGNRRWILPRDDYRILPIANTTTEAFAEFIADELQEAIFMKSPEIESFTVEVGESGGFSAKFTWRQARG